MFVKVLKLNSTFTFFFPIATICCHIIQLLCVYMGYRAFWESTIHLYGKENRGLIEVRIQKSWYCFWLLPFFKPCNNQKCFREERCKVSREGSNVEYHIQLPGMGFAKHKEYW